MDTIKVAICHPKRKHYDKGLCKNCCRTDQYVARHRENAKRWDTCNPGRRKQQTKEWFLTNPERHKELVRKSAFKLRYGLSLEDFEKLYLNQNKRCAICNCELESSGRKGPYIDHDHKTNIVRGLLCCICNMALRAMDNAPLWGNKAKQYLDNPPAPLILAISNMPAVRQSIIVALGNATALL